MARPQKQTVDYFPHDVGATTGDTLTALQGQFGNDGYAFWFKLLEKLASSDGHFIDCSNSQRWQVILGRSRVDEVTGKKMMVLLVEMQAVDKELWQNHHIIWCQNLVDNLAMVYQNRRRTVPQKPIPSDQLQPKLDLALEGAISTVETPHSTGNNAITTGDNAQSKVKYSRVEESIKDDGATSTSEQPTTTQTELLKLVGWGNSESDGDRRWLAEFIGDYPTFNVSHIRACRDYHSSKRKHTKALWKTRLRNWMNHENGQGRTDVKTKSRRLPRTYTKPPGYQE